MLRIRAKKPDFGKSGVSTSADTNKFWRCGREWRVDEWAEVDEAEFTPEELAILKADPRLEAVEVTEKTEE